MKSPNNPKPPADVGRKLEHHLQSALKRLGKVDQAHMILGQLYMTKAFRESDAALLERAKLHLSLGVSSFPETRMSLAELHRRLGESEFARQEATAALEHYAAKLEADPEDMDARIRVAASQGFLLKFGSAIRTLQEGLQYDAENPELKKALATAYVTAARAVKATTPRDIAKQLELLQQALRFDPNNSAILAGFAALTAQSDPAADAAREQLQDILVQGKAPATVHLILGTIAMQRDENKEAAYHLNQALELAPQMPEVLNNLAWHLTETEPPQLNRALELANRAAELRPGDINILDTRGHVLLKMGRHQEALKDLLIAVRASPDNPKTHESLAKIYEGLGDEAMAQRHRKQANSLIKQANSLKSK